MLQIPVILVRRKAIRIPEQDPVKHFTGIQEPVKLTRDVDQSSVWILKRHVPVHTIYTVDSFLWCHVLDLVDSGCSVESQVLVDVVSFEIGISTVEMISHDFLGTITHLEDYLKSLLLLGIVTRVEVEGFLFSDLDRLDSWLFFCLFHI